MRCFTPLTERRVAITVAALLATVACVGSSREISPNRALAIQDSVRVALAAYRRYAAAAQWDSLVRLYTTDSTFRWIEDGHRARGPAVRRAFTSVPPGVRIETNYDSTDIVALAPGLAVLTTYYDTRLVGPMSAHYSGAISMVWSHQPAGWRIVGGHSSSAVAHAAP